MAHSPKAFVVLFVSAIFLSTIQCHDYDPSDPVIQLSHHGMVRGQMVTVDTDKGPRTVYQYLGIPYAKPPIGDLRFADPVKHPGWQGVRDVKERPPTCWQFAYDNTFETNNPAGRMWINNTAMSEDCLYLNVWTPTHEYGMKRRKAVMVWIYGGGFTSGSSTLAVYDGSILAASQDVVVVSMQYRVGPFGFLRFEPQNNETDGFALGNQGLKDQALALQWVQENIARFDGNKRSVTIFGESAGSVSVSILWLIPKTRKLYRRAIMESGSMFARWGYLNRDEADVRGRVFAHRCGCLDNDRTRLLTCLRKVHPQILVDAIYEINDPICKLRGLMLQRMSPLEYNRTQDIGTYTCLYFDALFAPVVDEDFIPSVPETMLQTRPDKDAPQLLMGVNKNEGMYFLLYGLAYRSLSFLEANGDVELPYEFTEVGSVEERKNGDFTTISLAQFISNSMMTNLSVAEKPAYLYDIGKNSSQSGQELMSRLDEFTGDLDFICPTLKFADMASSRPNATVYVYSFEKRTMLMPMPKWTGVMHGYEIEYVFGMPRSKEFTNNFYKFMPVELDLSDKMMKMWANFAKHGDPTRNMTIQWPTYKSGGKKRPFEGRHLILDEYIRVGDNLRMDKCAFWFPK